jgi:hypothetical protein
MVIIERVESVAPRFAIVITRAIHPCEHEHSRLYPSPQAQQAHHIWPGNVARVNVHVHPAFVTNFRFDLCERLTTLVDLLDQIIARGGGSDSFPPA